MSKKCSGCGVLLQTTNIEEQGYTTKESNLLCERCFRIKNYGDYKVVIKDNNEFLNILNNINNTNDLVILVVDLFNISEQLKTIGQILNNPILLVLSKRDVMPKSLYDEKLLAYLDRYSLNIVDRIIISSLKNYQFDELYESIDQNKKTSTVYVVGMTNAGKSTMINKIIYNYSNNKTVITTSLLPSTTLDSIEIKINDDLTLVDTPGLLEEGNLINYVSGNELKRIVPNKEIKPITYQINTKQTIKMDKYAYLEVNEKANLTIFMSNDLNIDRTFKEISINNLDELNFDVNAGQDIVISGLGFIKMSTSCQVKIQVVKNVKVYLRDSLI